MKKLLSRLLLATLWHYLQNVGNGNVAGSIHSKGPTKKVYASILPWK